VGKERNCANLHKEIVREGDQPVCDIRQAHHLHHSPELELFLVHDVDQDDGHGQLHHPHVQQRAEQGREVEVQRVLGFGHLFHANHVDVRVCSAKHLLKGRRE
jgi:hypothetical protein